MRRSSPGRKMLLAAVAVAVAVGSSVMGASATPTDVGWTLGQLQLADGSPFYLAAAVDDGIVVVGDTDDGTLHTFTPDGIGGYVESTIDDFWDGPPGAIDSVDVQDGTIVVGDDEGVNGGQASGAVHLLRPDGIGGYDHTYLAADDGTALDFFGLDVALDGERVVVGAPGVGGFEGAVYVFEPDAAGGYHQQKLRNPVDGEFFFGTNLDAADGRIAVSTQDQGAAFVFEPDGIGGFVAHAVTPPGEFTESFGLAVAIDDDLLAVGDAGLSSGVVHLYRRGDEGWAYHRTVWPPYGVERFGVDVAVDDGVVAVLARNDVFLVDPDAWWRDELYTLPSPDGVEYLWSFDADGATIVVPAPLADPSTIYVMTAGGVPVNDRLENSIYFEGGTVHGSNVGATSDLYGRNEVWWTLNAWQHELVEIDTFGSDFDTQVHVYEGSHFVASNDDFGGPQSRTSFWADAGHEYHVAVSGADGAEGSITLTARTLPPPPNDGFDDRIDLGTTVPREVSGRLGNASYSWEVPLPPPWDDDEWWVGTDVFYTWTAPDAGDYRFAVAGRATQLAAWSGTEPAELELLGSGLRADVSLRAGETVQIGVYHDDIPRTEAHFVLLIGATCLGEKATMYGTAGDDVLVGSEGPDVIVGLGGDDRLSGVAGDDILCGGGGDDILVGGPGDDRVVGGEGADHLRGSLGVDTVDYSAATAGVEVVLNLRADDGRPGEGDRVDPSIEVVVGSIFADRLVGSAGPNRLDGGPGADELRGRGGNDVLIGGPGDDVLYGGFDGDDLIGGPGDDRLDGGRGNNDSCTGSAGSDTYFLCEVVFP